MLKICDMWKSGKGWPKLTVAIIIFYNINIHTERCNSYSWYRRFKLRHPEVKKTTVRGLEASRYNCEAGGLQHIETFFENLGNAVKAHRIGASECWNENEAGIRIGVLAGRMEVFVVNQSHKQQPRVVNPNNRESATLVGCANAAGDSIPPYIIFKSWPTEQWADLEGDDSMRFARSDTGSSNADIHFDWVHHFNVESWKASARAQRMGKTLEEWFGCDERLRDPLDRQSYFKEPPNRLKRAHEDKIWRLLVIDGFAGHKSFKFVNYCLMFDIILCILPPHSTHFLQPLDLAVFQPLKAAHQKAIRRHVQEGYFNYSRLDFARGFDQIYRMGFNPHNIINGFEMSGIFPVDPGSALRHLVAADLKAKRPIKPEHQQYLPSEARFHIAGDSIERTLTKYHTEFSSPTREALKNADLVVREAILLDQRRNDFIENRLDRISKFSSQRRRGKDLKPSGEFLMSLNLQEIRSKEAELQAKYARETLDKQRRQMHSLLVQEVHKFKEKYKAVIAKPRYRLARRPPSFTTWLRVVEKYNDYKKALHEKEQFWLQIKGKYNQEAEEGEDSFIIDTQRSQIAPIIKGNNVEDYISMGSSPHSTPGSMSSVEIYTQRETLISQ